MNMDTVVQYAGYLITILTILVSLYRARKAGQTMAQALIIAVNTLKDEDKMTATGQFTPETIKKAQDFATSVGADDAAIEKVKVALQGREIDLKVGTYKGKPIYLSEALGIAGLLRNIKKLF